jgi:hypothetical protein
MDWRVKEAIERQKHKDEFLFWKRDQRKIRPLVRHYDENKRVKYRVNPSQVKRCNYFQKKLNKLIDRNPRGKIGKTIDNDWSRLFNEPLKYNGIKVHTWLELKGYIDFKTIYDIINKIKKKRKNEG